MELNIENGCVISIKLDSYEQEIEENFEKQQKIGDPALIALFQKSAKIHVSKMSIMKATNRKAKKEFLKK